MKSTKSLICFICYSSVENFYIKLTIIFLLVANAGTRLSFLQLLVSPFLTMMMNLLSRGLECLWTVFLSVGICMLPYVLLGVVVLTFLDVNSRIWINYDQICCLSLKSHFTIYPWTLKRWEDWFFQQCFGSFN